MQTLRLIYHFNNNLDSITNKYKFLFSTKIWFYEARLLEGANLLPSSPIQYYLYCFNRYHYNYALNG